MTLISDSGSLQVLPGAALTVTEGNLTLQDLNTAAGSISIGQGASLNAGSTSGTGGQINMVVGSAPETPVPGTLPANVSVNASNGGQVFFGARAVIPLAPTNTVTANGGSVVFSTGTLPANAIVLGGGAIINAVASPDASFVVRAGFDLFETDHNTTHIRFQDAPVPADFFDPGSEPFAGTVRFQGVPLGSHDGHPTGGADTVVQRLGDMTFGTSLPDTATVPVELVALSLQSVSPITVNVGGRPQLWDVRVTLSPTEPSTGTMTVTRTHENGGMFDSQLQVYPVFTFTRLGDGAERVLEPTTPFPLDDVDSFDVGAPVDEAPWRTECPERAQVVPGWNGDGFCPGVGMDASGRVVARWHGASGALGVRPALVQPPEYDAFPNSTMRVTLTTPTGGSATVELTGPSKLVAHVGDARDRDGDGLDEVETELVAMDLTAGALGDISVRVQRSDTAPFARCECQMEEQVNTEPGRLDVPPLAPTGSVYSFLDVGIEIRWGGQVLHTTTAHRLTATISNKAGAPGETYEDTAVLPLYDASGNLAGVNLGPMQLLPVPDFMPHHVADLVVSKTDSPDPVVAGETLTYTITATNAGPDAAPHVVLSDSIDAGLVGVALLSVAPSQGLCLESDAIICSLGMLAAGASATVEVVVVPSAPAALSNTAVVGHGSSDTDPNPDNNQATAETEVLSAARHLTVTKSGAGRGTVASEPPGINCGSTCQTTYWQDTNVILSANGAGGSVFTGWSGACSGTGPCTVAMDGAKSVNAAFSAPAPVPGVSLPGLGALAALMLAGLAWAMWRRERGAQAS